MPGSGFAYTSGQSYRSGGIEFAESLMRLPIDRRSQKKKKGERARLATSRAGFAVAKSGPLVPLLLRATSVRARSTPTSEARDRMHHRECVAVIRAGDAAPTRGRYIAADFHERTMGDISGRFREPCVRDSSHTPRVHAARTSHYSDILFRVRSLLAERRMQMRRHASA